MAADPEWQNPATRPATPLQELRARVADLNTSTTAENTWLLRVELETIEGLQEKGRYDVVPVDGGTSATLGALFGASASVLDPGYIASLAPAPSLKFADSARRYVALVGVLRGAEEDPAVSKAREVRDRIAALEAELSEWNEVVADPTKLAGPEKAKVVSDATDAALALEAQVEIASGTVQDGEAELAGASKAREAALAERDRIASELGLATTEMTIALDEARMSLATPGPVPTPYVPTDRAERGLRERGIAVEKVDAFLAAVRRLAEAQGEEEEARHRLEGARSQVEKLKGEARVIAGRRASPARTGTPEQLERARVQARQRVAALQREVSDTRQASERYELAAEDRRAHWASEARKYPVELVAAVGETLRAQALVMEYLHDWPAFARSEKMRSATIRRLRRAVGSRQIPIDETK